LGHPLVLAAAKSYSEITEARRIERMLKAWKNPAKALEYLST
jgi:hypothetical protein